MFLRKRANRILLLHSYRDGAGKVCQARLADFRGGKEARELLASTQWRREFELRFPGRKVDWSKLAEQARGLPDDTGKPVVSKPLNQRFEAAFRAFLRLWDQLEDSQRRDQVAETLRERMRLAELPPATPEDCLESGGLEQLQVLEWKSRASLDPRRSSLEDESGETYRKTLARRAELLQAEGQAEQARQLWKQLVEVQPSEHHLARYGAILQKLGLLDEAAEQYRRISKKCAVRSYNLASLHLQQNEMDAALIEAMNGMLSDSRIARATGALREGRQPNEGREYWEKFGHLWDPIGRWFLMGTYAQPLVRVRLGRAAEARYRPRVLVRGKARDLLLTRVLYWDPPQKVQPTARRRRSKTASQAES
jgi:tetratricopeptide (TPR) repeat protein